MKTKTSIKLICCKCFLVKRYKRFFIFCVNKKHKQRQK